MEYDPYLGRLISDKYRIIDFIGEGGMGSVYLAEHESLPRKYAIKILKSEYLDDENYIERFRREAIAASRVVHPNIVYITDFGHLEEGNFYIVMEYLEGEGLDSILETHGKIPLTRAMPILIQVADALDYAHSLGIVHRDLKSENVLLARERGKKDVVKILDFGIARLLLPSFARTRITLHGQVFGTPEYMSPEQASDKPLDGRSDIYAIGILAYELVTGNPPFLDDDPTEILQAHLSTQPAPPSSKMPGQPIPEIFDGMVLKCLAKKPDDRYQTAGSLRSDLLRIRNLITRMAREIIISDMEETTVTPIPATSKKQYSSSLKVAGNVMQSNLQNIPESKSVVELRYEYHNVLKELVFYFEENTMLNDEHKSYLDELITLESELDALNANILFKEQEFEKIRFEYGQQEKNLKFAHMDLEQEFRNISTNSQNIDQKTQAYLDDLKFQIEALSTRSKQIVQEKRAKINELNNELKKYRISTEERELQISHIYSEMQHIIDNVRVANFEKVALENGVLFEKLDHLKDSLELMRRKAGSI